MLWYYFSTLWNHVTCFKKNSSWKLVNLTLTNLTLNGYAVTSLQTILWKYYGCLAGLTTNKPRIFNIRFFVQTGGVFVPEIWIPLLYLRYIKSSLICPMYKARATQDVEVIIHTLMGVMAGSDSVKAKLNRNIPTTINI